MKPTGSIHPEDGYVFIVTYGRSGSTLLQNLLNSIPGYQIRGENNNALLPLVRSWNAVESAVAMRGLRKAGETTDQSHPWFGAENVDPDEVGEALTKCFVQTVLKPDPGTRVSGFKEIRYHKNPEFFDIYLDFVHKFFPNARFVFNTRNLADVARSGWWRTVRRENVMDELTQAEALYHAYLKAHPERGILLHYDDYLENPSSLCALYEFLGETQDPEVLQRVMQTRLTHLQNEET